MAKKTKKERKIDLLNLNTRVRINKIERMT